MCVCVWACITEERRKNDLKKIKERGGKVVGLGGGEGGWCAAILVRFIRMLITLALP